jgi:hypothetical protein
MRTLLYLIITILAPSIFYLCADAQVQTVPIPDEGARNSERTFINYDGTQRIAEVIQQEWLITGAWANSQRTLHTYTDEGRTIRRVLQYWEDGMWNLATRETETHNINNELTTHAFERWGAENDWVPERRESFTYENNLRTQWVSQTWSAKNGWQYEWQFNFFNDEQENLIDVSFDIWTRSGWIINRRITDEYIDGKQHERIIYEMIGRSLTPAQAFEYQYDEESGKRIRQIMRLWTGTTWRDSEEERYEYDEEGRLTKIEYLNPANNQIIARDIYTYDDEQNTSERVRENRLPDGTLREDWRYVEALDFRGYRTTKSYFTWQNGRWIEQYRQTFGYDIYGNLTSTTTQR